jgi:transcriptional regulator with XRE-family HTH domain
MALRHALGAVIREIRTAKDLRQTDLGDSGNISRLEDGQQGLTATRLVDVAKSLNTPLWMLFARAEGAIDNKLWRVMTVYQNSYGKGLQMIDYAVGVADEKYRREKSPFTVAPRINDNE